MLRRLRQIVESYLFILCASIVVGLLVPAARNLAAWGTFFLQVIFFLSSLKLDVRDVARHAKDWKLLLLANGFMLIGLPILVRFGAPVIVPDLAFSLFLLAAMPAGMTSPLLVEVVGGNHALALVLTVATSLLAPLTVPFITAVAYGTTVHVDAIGMFRNLLLVIVIPFMCAVVLRRLVPAAAHRINPRSKPFSVLLLGFLVAGAVAKQAQPILTSTQEGWGILRTLAVLYFFFFLLHLFGYAIAWWKPREERKTVAVCLTYMNFTLAIFLATTFFPTPDVLLPLVLSIVPWATLLPVWKAIMLRKRATQNK